MSSIVAICNLALSNIGKENIQSLNEASAEARACRQFYDITRDILLQAYPWRFAESNVALAEIANSQPGAWRHAFAIPSDCLKVRGVFPSAGSGREASAYTEHPYSVAAGVIHCNLPVAYLEFTSRVVDPSRFSPLFTDALAWQLAVRLAMPLTRDPKMRAEAWQVAQEMTGQAQMADANEVRENYWTETDLIEGRR